MFKKVKLNINNILYILILLIVIVLIICKCISLHQNMTENFEDTNESIQRELGEIKQDVDKHLEDHNEGKVVGCPKSQDGNDIFNSIVSKYSGKIINIEQLEGEKYKDGNTEYHVYLIKWQPLGGKPGGCITCNDDGTFSTPICDLQNNKQKWYIKKIENETEWKKEIDDEDRQKMGRHFTSTDFPFHIVVSKEYNDYVLNYEGGGLSIRKKANYDGLKWDVSKDKIKQDPLPTHQGNKFLGLTPGHKMTDGDKTLNGAFDSPLGNMGNKNDGNGITNLNLNLDPDLLSKINTLLNNQGGMNGFSSAGGNYNSGNGNSNGKDDFLKKSNGDKSGVSEMFKSDNHKPSCSDCGKIPENYIKKDLVKSMCIGCNNIDNVLT